MGTTYADRQEIIRLRQRGDRYWEIVQRPGWRYETVRQVCRRCQREGEGALQPRPIGRPKNGPLSTFDPKVRWAVLKIKRQHPGWGPDIILAELRQRAWVSGQPLPSAASIGAYLSQFGNRLLQPRPHRQLSGAQARRPALPMVHGCWQLDSDEKLHLPGYGLVNILNIVDHSTGIKIGANLFPAQQNGKGCRISWPQYRQALRQAFARWGLPARIRTDCDRVLVSRDNYPFPMDFTLWLVGLGIEHELIQRVTQNGCVERSHRTWEGRLDGYGPYSSLSQWQELVDYERWRMNAILPSRGRHCQRQPPLLVYPQARQPYRFYRLADESLIFQMARVEAYLAQGKWLRRSNGQGQFWLNNQVFHLRVAYKKRWVQITYLPTVGFLASCPPSQDILLIFHLDHLTAVDIVGLA